MFYVSSPLFANAPDIPDHKINLQHRPFSSMSRFGPRGDSARYRIRTTLQRKLSCSGVACWHEPDVCCPADQPDEESVGLDAAWAAAWAGAAALFSGVAAWPVTGSFQPEAGCWALESACASKWAPPCEAISVGAVSAWDIPTVPRIRAPAIIKDRTAGFFRMKECFIGSFYSGRKMTKMKYYACFPNLNASRPNRQPHVHKFCSITPQ